jgi:hypothetical protein
MVQTDLKGIGYSSYCAANVVFLFDRDSVDIDRGAR